MFPSLLIANRAEIACRIARTARRIGLETIAVFSDADAGALHTEAADRAIRIGPAPARDSYLNIPAIIDAARKTGAAAIHPGYGFLSENPAFAEACLEAGLVWVGPPPAAMRAMGSKSAAKALMQSSGVPVLPGYHGADQSPQHLANHAEKIGLPVVIKAVAGGGGRGMRVVHHAAEFPAALAAARQESASAFGDDTVLIERYLQRPRHIEVQIFADSHGNAVHLFERDCSAQRRHQKVIEEAPAPGLAPETRNAMGAAAVAAARAVGYTGAGTVEFVFEHDAFYFLEMNTRLQVEHPVTELITGFDLVEWQLRVAAGEPLPAEGDAIRIHGHAFEARIYAEDPARDFAPSIGRIQALRLPDTVRVDTGVRAGDDISIHYDPMIAKLICHADTRAQALGKLRRALAECQVAGVTTNLDLLGRIAAHPAFTAGGIDTGFIARNGEALLHSNTQPPPRILALAALGVIATQARETAQAAARSADPHSPWHATDGWWLNATIDRTLIFQTDPPTVIHLRPAQPSSPRPSSSPPLPSSPRKRGPSGLTPPPGDARLPAPPPWYLTITNETFTGRAALHPDGTLHAELDGARHHLHFHLASGTVVLRDNGETWRLTLADPAAEADAAADNTGRLVAPIPGQVTAVHANPGDHVTRGALLIVMEAMKTVFRLNAPADATVSDVACKPGDIVQEGQLLVRFADNNEST